MKGLLVKDFYMLIKYGKMYLLTILGFGMLAVFMRNNMLFISYLGVFSGMIPVTLMSYDEHSKWTVYSQTLPYSKTQLVSVKYLMGLIVQLSVLVIVGVALAARMCADHTFVAGSFYTMMVMLIIVPLLFGALLLPFMFRFGVEKGRIAFAVVLGLGFTCSLLFSNYYTDTGRVFGNLAVNALIVIVLYAASWLLSTAIYEKREIT